MNCQLRNGERVSLEPRRGIIGVTSQLMRVSSIIVVNSIGSRLSGRSGILFSMEECTSRNPRPQQSSFVRYWEVAFHTASYVTH